MTRFSKLDFLQGIYANSVSKKGIVWISKEQQDTAKALRTVEESGIELSRFQALSSYFTCRRDLCCPQEETQAAALIEISKTGLAKNHFENKASRWCSPSQLALAKAHSKACTIDIASTGLELSRFQKLGLGPFCTPSEVEKARALLDATKVQPGGRLCVPLGFYSDSGEEFDSDGGGGASLSEPEDSDDYEREPDPHSESKGPIWVTPAQHRRASDRWDAESIAYDIDTQWGEMPWGGAYSDSLEYASDGNGGYMGQGCGF
jgi:hypothetical protein